MKVPKICRWWYRGRIQGCGRVWEGWTWKDRTPACKALREAIIEESGEVWAVCDSCADRLDRAAQARQRKASQPEPTGKDKMRPPVLPEERYDL